MSPAPRSPARGGSTADEVLSPRSGKRGTRQNLVQEECFSRLLDNIQRYEERPSFAERLRSEAAMRVHTRPERLPVHSSFYLKKHLSDPTARDATHSDAHLSRHLNAQAKDRQALITDVGRRLEAWTPQKSPATSLSARLAAPRNRWQLSAAKAVLEWVAHRPSHVKDGYLVMADPAVVYSKHANALASWVCDVCGVQGRPIMYHCAAPKCVYDECGECNEVRRRMELDRHGHAAQTAAVADKVERQPRPPASSRRETDLTAAATVWSALTTSGLKLLSAKWIIGKAREAPTVGLGYDRLGRRVPLPKQVMYMYGACRAPSCTCTCTCSDGECRCPSRSRGSKTQPSPFTLHPSPFTLHPSPFTLHPSPFTLHPSPFTLQGGQLPELVPRRRWANASATRCCVRAPLPRSANVELCLPPRC